MSYFKLTFTLLFIAIVMGMQLNNNSTEHQIVGEFGNESMLSIQFKADHTFDYKDISKKKLIQIQGVWEFQNDTILLISNSKQKIFKYWKLVNNDGCIRSKKYMTIMTLCKNCQ